MTVLFLDSGSFTLHSRSLEYAEENNCERWDYYDTDDFWEYMDQYIQFVLKHEDVILLYANMDVIYNPKLTWRNQKYLEQGGINPVPVVHRGTNLRWLKRYIKLGYEIIAFGGMVAQSGQTVRSNQLWLDRCFSIVCNTHNNLPCIKTHGFGITSYKLLTRYPWYSVDSVTWAKRGAFGEILVPRKRGGQFVFNVSPHTIAVSMENPNLNTHGEHLLSLPKLEYSVVLEWLDLIGIPLGKHNNQEVIKQGIVTNPYMRWDANLLFFEMLRKSLPKYPWAWPISPTRKGFT